MKQDLENFTKFLSGEWEGARDVLEYRWEEGINLGGAHSDAFHVAQYEVLDVAMGIAKEQLKGDVTAVDEVAKTILKKLESPEYIANLSAECISSIEEYEPHLEYKDSGLSPFSNFVKPVTSCLPKNKKINAQRVGDIKEGLENVINLVEESGQYFASVDSTKAEKAPLSLKAETYSSLTVVG